MIGPITAEKVIEVALNPDDELRNQQVALLYSLTSERLRHTLAVDGSTHHDANWFTIAQWAVLTVGRNMRTTALPHRAQALPTSVRRRVTPALLSIRAAADRRVAAALSYGQVRVLCSVYAALLRNDKLCNALARTTAAGPRQPHLREPRDVFRGGPTIRVESDTADGDDPPLSTTDSDDPPTQPHPQPTTDDEEVKRELAIVARHQYEELEREQAAEAKARAERRELQRELAGLLGVEAKALPAVGDADFAGKLLEAIAALAEHQVDLDEAFALYNEALEPASSRKTTDPTPCELIFQANLRIAAVEQLILDDAVTMVVDHVPKYLADTVEDRLVGFAERTMRVPRRVARVNASRRLSNLTTGAQQVWARVMTDHVMVVALPTETIRLGRDMPPRPSQDSFYAPCLRTLSTGSQELFDQFDRSLGDGRAASAGDWRRFDDRMNFVCNLLRSRHADSTLFWRPFTDEDAALVWSGRYPMRTADPFEQSVRAPDLPAGLGGFR